MALPSCYPDLIAKKKAAAAIEEFPVEDLDESSQVEAEFADVAGLLEDHMQAADVEGDDFPEADVAVVLATAWREPQELSKLQKSIQFGKAKEVRRAFRVEVE